MRRLIWVYAVCICSLFECIQPVPHVRTLNFRLATTLVSVMHEISGYFDSVNSSDWIIPSSSIILIHSQAGKRITFYVD